MEGVEHKLAYQLVDGHGSKTFQSNLSLSIFHIKSMAMAW